MLMSLVLSIISYLYSLISLLSIIGNICFIYLLISVWLYNFMATYFYIGDEHTSHVRSLITCFIIFIFTEILVFLSFFWSYQNTLLDSGIYTGLTSLNINLDNIAPLHPDIPGLMSVILFGSSIFAFLYYSPQYSQQHYFVGLSLLVCVGICFGFIEYGEYTSSIAPINTGIYFTYKFVITGLHFLHIVLGVLLMIYVVLSILLNLFSLEGNVLLFNSFFYWQFVDIVWAAVYVTQFVHLEVFCLGILNIDMF